MDYYRQNELPETVKRYKAYTDSFQEWLMKTAVQRGVENAARIAEQAKKKKSTKKYKITTDEQELLVDGIANAGLPLDDTSGLRDLRDAIYSRKEVNQYHKFAQTLDAGHSFFNAVLESAQSKLTALVKMIPAALKTQDMDNHASNFVVFHFCDEDSDDDEDRGDLKETIPKAPEAVKQQREDPRQNLKKKKRNGNALTKADAELQCDFLVLCFLYELNRIRDILRDVWLSYCQGTVNAITASLVTDFAQSHLQQSVAGLEEDLASYAPFVQLSLPQIIRRLYMNLSAPASVPPQLSVTALRHLLCIDSLDCMEAYLKLKDPHRDGKRDTPDAMRTLMSFLRHFDTVRHNKIELPIWDKFTERMMRQTTSLDASLPFAFEIVLDASVVLREDGGQLFKDVTGQGLDIARLIRLHSEYEDQMWAAGTKPDYMSKGNMKFSNVYLSSLDKLLDWLQEVLRNDDSPSPTAKMTTGAFLEVHSTLAGLSMWNFAKTYHGFSTAKVRWFITAIAHLYNAAQQIGGLEVEWPDLEYIIKMHGPSRVFTGTRPKDPQDFYERYMMSSCVSSSAFSKDNRLRGAHYAEVSSEVKKKRGLNPYLPIEDTISKYYGPITKGDRWIQQHAVFNHLHQLQSIRDEVESDETPVEQLRATFSSVFNAITPPRSKNRKKAKRVAKPDVSQIDDTHARLLLVMRSELQAHELHSEFDYLSFFRRAFDFVLRVRSQVLFDHALQLVRRRDINKIQDPSAHDLLAELFFALKIKPKDKKVEAIGQEVSKDVVPLDQLKHIAKLMGDMISAEGSAELNRAKMRQNRNWEGLKAEYEAEEARRYGPKAAGDELAGLEQEPDTGLSQGPSEEESAVGGKETVPIMEPTSCDPENASQVTTGLELAKTSESGNLPDGVSLVTPVAASASTTSASALQDCPDGFVGDMDGDSSQKPLKAYVSDAADGETMSQNEPPKDPELIIEAVVPAPGDEDEDPSTSVPQLDRVEDARSVPAVLEDQPAMGTPSVDRPASPLLEKPREVKPVNARSMPWRRGGVAGTGEKHTMSEQKPLEPFEWQSVSVNIPLRVKSTNEIAASVIVGKAAEEPSETEDAGAAEDNSNVQDAAALVLPIDEQIGARKSADDDSDNDTHKQKTSLIDQDPPSATVRVDSAPSSSQSTPTALSSKPSPVSTSTLPFNTPDSHKPGTSARTTARDPNGVFHRIKYPARKRSAYLKRTIPFTPSSARFALAPYRKRPVHCFFGAARKHSVSFRCYARCSMGHALLGTESSWMKLIMELKDVARGAKMSDECGKGAGASGGTWFGEDLGWESA